MKKHYIWKGVLCDWTDGIAFAIADSEEEAIAALNAAGVRKDWTDREGSAVDWIKERIIDPGKLEVHEAPYADFIFGGG